MIESTRNQRRQLEKDNKKFSTKFVKVKRAQWPGYVPKGLFEVWRNQDYLIQLFHEERCVDRMSVCTTHIDTSQLDWTEGISWNDLQHMKQAIGRGSQSAVEIYPPEDCIVNVANMRHLWLLPEPPFYMWQK